MKDIHDDFASCSGIIPSAGVLFENEAYFTPNLSQTCTYTCQRSHVSVRLLPSSGISSTYCQLFQETGPRFLIMVHSYVLLHYSVQGTHIIYCLFLLTIYWCPFTITAIYIQDLQNAYTIKATDMNIILRYSSVFTVFIGQYIQKPESIRSNICTFRDH